LITYNWFRPENRFMAGLPLRKRSGRLFLFFFRSTGKRNRESIPGEQVKQEGPVPQETSRACAVYYKRSLCRRK
jgi:hypothetical protein